MKGCRKVGERKQRASLRIDRRGVYAVRIFLASLEGKKKKSELGDGRLFEREDIFERKKDHLRVRGEGRARAKKKPKGMKGAFSGMTL